MKNVKQINLNILLLYASQSGTAELIASNLFKQYKPFCNIVMMTLDD